MAEPLLKLLVQKGPQAGQTIERKWGAKIRIGRVVKGNNFTIKDSGISSKHLLIETQDGNWVVFDLDTSNGTFLNGVQILPNKGIVLKDGDLVKIGELTSIKVSIVIEQEKEEMKTKQVKGGLRKVGKNGAGAVSGLVVEVGDLCIDEEIKPKEGKEGLKKKVVEDVSASVGVEEVKEMEVESGVGQRRRNPRRRAAVGEGAKAKAGAEAVSGSVGVDEEKNIELENGVGQGRRYPRRGAAVKNQECSLVSVNKNQKTKGKEKQEPPVVENRGRPRRIRGVAVSENEPLESVNAPDENSQAAATSISVAGEQEVQEKLNLSEEKLTYEKLKKMTLGEWFDYVEGFFVKKIHEETDEIIANMQAKAEQYKEFMLEQHRLKRKSPLS